MQISCSEGVPPYTIDFGDGSLPISCSGVTTHTYEPPYAENEYEISVSCEDGWGTTTVSILNHPPEFYGIYTVGDTSFAERELILLRVGFFVMGCPDCEQRCGPCEIYGGTDPDGDPLTYGLHICREGFSAEDSIFDLQGNRVNGSATSGDFLVWFPAWRSAKPPFPFYPFAATCVRGVGLAGPVLSEMPCSPKGNFFGYHVSLQASDLWGASCTYETVWEVMEMER